MASTFFGLTISYTGLQAANTSINVTAHNISNINTDGYTKQQASLAAGDALRTYSTYGTIGTGVMVEEILQIRDSYYDDKYRNNQANYGQYSVKNNYMTQIENYLNEFTLKGYSVEYKNFFTAVNQMTLTPGEASAKNNLVNNAKNLTDYFNTLSTNLRNVQVDANNEIKDAVEKINSISQNIASLTKQINQIESSAGNANDLRDRRNALVDELSGIANIETSEQSIGNGLTTYNVYLNGQNLVNTYNYNQLQVVAREDKKNVSDAAGLYDIQWTTGQNFDIYSSSLGGQLKGLVDLRDGCNGTVEEYAKNESGDYILDSNGDKTLTTKDQSTNNTNYKGVPYYQAQLNEFMKTFTEQVNTILKSGFTEDGKPGVSLFVTNDGADTLTAGSVTVNSALLDDSNLLATKSSIADGQAKCDIMEKLNMLQKDKVFNGGTGEFFLESIVSDMSIDASKATNMEKNYKNLKTSIHNQRLSVMGVDTDEEAMDLIKFQQAYNLNSKMLSVMNEIYDKLINQTGV